MNATTKWFEHPLYLWMNKNDFSSMDRALEQGCTEEVVEGVLQNFENVELKEIRFYPAGTYREPEKTVLDNIDDFYLISMTQKVSKNHTGTFRVYLPVKWNHRFMGIAGAGSNNEVDWFTSVTFNVISWPMALMNGYACAVADNDTGIRLDCTWGFDDQGQVEWDHIEAWAYQTLHEMTVCAKALTEAAYGQKIIASYMHGTSGGGRQVISEALHFPEDYDGVWADGPSIDYLDLTFACLWAAVVEANEKHIVALEKYQAAFDLATSDPNMKDFPFDSRDIIWMDFINKLLDLDTPAGPITRRDLQVMVKTWDGPFTRNGKRMAYGFGPAIQQWPVDTVHTFYGYLQRKEDGLYGLMPIAEQNIRWFTGNPDFDLRTCSYEEYERIYLECRKAFSRYDFNETDFSAYAARGGKLIITHGTGDCVIPYQYAIDYYNRILDHFPSEKIMNDSVRLYMPYLAGHSILDWSGGAVACAVGMRALTEWTEHGIASDILPVVRYDFIHDEPARKGQVESFNQWKFRKSLKR